MTSMRKRTIRRPSSVSSRTMSARDGGWACWLLAWFSGLENISAMIERWFRGCQGAAGSVFYRREHGDFLGGGTRFWKSCAKLFCWVGQATPAVSVRCSVTRRGVVTVATGKTGGRRGSGFQLRCDGLESGRSSGSCTCFNSNRQGRSPNPSGMEITRGVFQFWRDAPALGQVKRQQREGHCHQDQAQNAYHSPGPHIHQLVQPQFYPGQQPGVGAPFMVC